MNLESLLRYLGRFDIDITFRSKHQNPPNNRWAVRAYDWQRDGGHIAEISSAPSLLFALRDVVAQIKARKKAGKR